MRIKKLDLIRYGKFGGEALSFPLATRDFHIVVGPNEAGKSTLRNAVLELLFGMRNQTPFGFLHEITELRLGGVLESSAGETIFHRARGRSQLRTPADDKLPDDYLAPLLGGVTKEFFEQMFGLDHERLLEGGRSILDASKDLGRVLFQSAAGIGSLAPVREALEVRAGELWTKRKSSSEYTVAEARFLEAGAELKAAQVRPKVWSDARDALDVISQEIAKGQTESGRLESLRSKLERVRRLAPFLGELAVKKAELAALGDVVDLPPTAYATLTTGQAALAGARAGLEERRRDVEARQAERDKIETDERALALAAEIEELDTARGACVNHPKDLLRRQVEVDRLLEEAYAAAAQLGWPTGEAELRARLPGDLALKTVTKLLRNQGAFHQAVVNAKEAAEEQERDLQTLRGQLAGITASEVPEALRVALAEAQVLKNSRSKQRTLAQEVEDAGRQLEGALGALGRWRTSLEVMRAMELPSSARMTSLQRIELERLSAVASARDLFREAEALVERLELEEKQFTEGHKVVTSVEVYEARAGRDGAWNDIKSGVSNVDAGAPILDAAIRLADELVDSQLGTATEAAELQSIRQQAELARLDLARKCKALEERERELAEFREDWEKETRAAGVPGMALDDFSEWRTKRDSVFAADGVLQTKHGELASEAAAYQSAAAILEGELKRTSVVVAETADLATLISTAEAFVRNADTARAQKEGLKKQVEQGERKLLALGNRVRSSTSDYQTWKSQWQQALQDANLTGAATTLTKAEGAVELAGSVAEKLHVAAEIRRTRICAMQADLDALGLEARRAAGLLDKDLLKLDDSSEIAMRLTARLRTAVAAKEAATRADNALREATARKEEAERLLAEVEGRLQPLLAQAGVETIEEALPLAERSDKHRQLIASIQELEHTLMREGDGLTREAIEAEVAEQDPALVVGLLEQTKIQITAISELMSALVRRQVEAQQAFSAISGNANAATAEAKRQEAIATMGETAEQYIELTTASRLLKWAIDRYRDQKQGPMLQRAGEVFAQLTLGQFTKLVADHVRNPPALIAKRSSGKLVQVEGLSEGTRDQLFLALRIAALELHLEHATALPFIADDLFVNFDDMRAKAGLEALRELSTRTQVIFLTHHDHLLPIARDVFGSELNILALEGESIAV